MQRAVVGAVLFALALAMASTGSFGQEEEPESVPEVTAEEVPIEEVPVEEIPVEPPSLEALPGILLLASTRENGALTERIDRYRLYTLQGGAVQRLRYREEELGSISAALSRDARRVLVNAGGQVLYLIDLSSGSATTIGERLPPLSFVQTDIYLSVTWWPDETRVLVVRPHPVGMNWFALDGISRAPLPYVGSRPALSPDGQWIAYGRLAEGAPVATLHVAPEDGRAEPTKVTADEFYELAPVWSPDGNGIVYLAAAGDSWQVRLWDLAAGEGRVLTEAPADHALDDLALSPDGLWVAYTIQNWRTLHRWVRITSVGNPRLFVDLPQEQTWSDRVLGWVSGPEAPVAPPSGEEELTPPPEEVLIPAADDPGWAWHAEHPGWMVLIDSDHSEESNWYFGGLDDYCGQTGLCQT